MRNTKLIAGLSVTALAALGITVSAFSGNNKQESVKDVQADNVQIEAEAEATVEYTGNAFVSSSLLSALQANVENNAKLGEQTGTLMYSAAGMSEALDGYGTYMASADTVSGDASVEALDVALKFVPEESVIEGYTNLGVSNVSSYLNVRSAAGLENDIVGKMPGGSACEILGEEGDWYQIQSGDVVGYVAKEYILTGYDANVKAMETMQNVLRVNCDVLNVRQEPSVDCSVSTQVESGEILEIVEQNTDGWYKVNINNLEGYVSAEFVDSIYTLPTADKIAKLVADTDSDDSSSGASYSSSGVSQTAVDLINYAYQFLGNPYVYGGNSLTNGIDCSGFVQQIFAAYGYSMPRTSLAYAGVGTTISYSEAKPGDILVYKYADGSGHVAIYIGDGQIIHASTPATGICIGNATFTTPYSVQRVLP
jgi:cell wall-associated NlpC family hydrolase